MTTYPDNTVLPITLRLLECLRSEAAQNPNPPALVGFRTGTLGEVLAGLSADECCGGAAFVRVLRTGPTWGVPNASTTPIKCGQARGMTVELSMWRCGSIGTMEEPPTQADWNCLHVDLLNDQVTLRAAACCFVRQWETGSVVIEEWTPVPIQGGCVGSTLTMQIDILRMGS